MENKDKIYSIALIGSFIIFLFVLWYILTHSPEEYVTKTEFYVAIIGMMSGFSTMFWAIWSKLSDLSMKIGEIYGWRNGFTKRKK